MFGNNVVKINNNTGLSDIVLSDLISRKVNSRTLTVNNEGLGTIVRGIGFVYCNGVISVVLEDEFENSSISVVNVGTANRPLLRLSI